MKIACYQKSLVFLFCLVLFLPSCESKKNKEQTATTFYLIRHAEKNRYDPSDRDPNLTATGLKRAELFASYFDSIQLDKIYSTNYARTRQTVEPLSDKSQIPIEFYDPNSLIDDKFIHSSKGQNILICGHSNTTPMLVNQLIGKDTYPDMDDNDNSSLYVVHMEGESIEVTIYKVNLPEDIP